MTIVHSTHCALFLHYAQEEQMEKKKVKFQASPSTANPDTILAAIASHGAELANIFMLDEGAPYCLNLCLF